MDVELTTDMTRWWFAAAILTALAIITFAALRPRRKASGRARADYLVLYASQTGQAEEIAQNTAERLRAGGLEVAVLSAADASLSQLQTARTILGIISTTGDGDAPDEAIVFTRTIMASRPDLSRQSYAVLALGDRNYERYCAFGHRFFDWLRHCGARSLMSCLEVDDLDQAALAHWERFLQSLGAVPVVPEVQAFSPWRLVRRELLNPGGGADIYRIGLLPETAMELAWHAGDLAEIETPDGHRRDYSIATVPSEGELDLLVRQIVQNDGGFGRGSGRLTHELSLGESVSLRIKAHKAFRAPSGEGPILLVGAGSGLAGLRGHILEAFADKRSTWLIFGERDRNSAAIVLGELEHWRESGVLGGLDCAFSQPELTPGFYVQDVLRQCAREVVGYLGNGGAVMVCGGVAMGRGVEAALRDVLGQEWVDAAFTEGRYRRDLY